MNEFAPNVWIAEGPTVDFLSFPYPTRMVVVRLTDPPDGSGPCAWIWSPVTLSDELAQEVESKAGPIKYIISPNKIHHLFMKEWADKYPDAKVYASPGLEERNVAKGVKFDARFGEGEPPLPFANEIDTVIITGSYFMDEVEFFHKASKTAIICDVIQRHPESSATGFKGAIMKLDGVVGEEGSAPREWRFSFWPFGKEKLRTARDAIFAWKAEKLIVAHGMCVDKDASVVIEKAMSWI